MDLHRINEEFEFFLEAVPSMILIGLVMQCPEKWDIAYIWDAKEWNLIDEVISLDWPGTLSLIARAQYECGSDRRGEGYTWQ